MARPRTGPKAEGSDHGVRVIRRATRMRRRSIIILISLLLILLLAARAWFSMGGASDQPSDPSAAELGCCQCTAIGRDQSDPFPKVPGETCAEHCYQGCLERGYAEIVCTLGRVGGYALACPGDDAPPATPAGE